MARILFVDPIEGDLVQPYFSVNVLHCALLLCYHAQLRLHRLELVLVVRGLLKLLVCSLRLVELLFQIGLLGLILTRFDHLEHVVVLHLTGMLRQLCRVHVLIDINVLIFLAFLEVRVILLLLHLHAQELLILQVVALLLLTSIALHGVRVNQVLDYGVVLRDLLLVHLLHLRLQSL